MFSFFILKFYLNVFIMNLMKVIYCNCKEASHPNKIGRIKIYMNDIRPHFFCLVETRADHVWTFYLCTKFANKWEWAAFPAICMSGVIIVFWNKHIGKITLVSSYKSSLHLINSSSNNDHSVHTIVYNSDIFSIQRKHWYYLSGLSSLNISWLVVGDSNAITVDSEHKGGNFLIMPPKPSISTILFIKMVYWM